MPTLVVAPIERIRPHEDFDPFRVDRLRDRIEADGTQLNPMVCAEATDGSYVLLDGATRREAFRRLGLPHAVIQLVDPTTVSLDTWHHVLNNGEAAGLWQSIEADPGLSLTPDGDAPRINISGSGWHHITAVDMTDNAALNALVDCYHGRMTVTRVTDPDPEVVTRTQPDWVAIVEFPSLTIEDVMVAATQADFVPAGITRFVVPERALRLNIPLDFLAGSAETAAKQSELDGMLARRAREGRVRRYDEPVFILDD